MTDLLKVIFVFYLFLPFAIGVAILHYDLWLWVIQQITLRFL
jgi:hypothetical protein